jgi:hypothetical protein
MELFNATSLLGRTQRCFTMLTWKESWIRTRCGESFRLVFGKQTLHFYHLLNVRDPCAPTKSDNNGATNAQQQDAQSKKAFHGSRKDKLGFLLMITRKSTATKSSFPRRSLLLEPLGPDA